MKQTMYLIVAALFFSCQQQKQITAETPSIKGNWQGEIKNDFHPRSRFISFEDSICTNSQPWGNDLKYTISHDTIFIQSAPQDKYQQKYQYTILKLTNDSLVLFADSTDGIPADTIALAKVVKKNTLKPSAIYFASGACFGTCPTMYFEIDSARNFTFFGDRFTEPKGGVRGKVSATEYESILNQINQLPVDSLKEFYRAGYTDAQTKGIAIEADGKLIKSTVYGSEQEPVELTMLLNKLMHVYEHVSLTPDTTVNLDYFSKHPAAKPTTTLTTFPEPKN
ncbi:hypothetical protein A4H97_04430 [Niastella yeongjuensis]|uniref:DUF6438 domain-containing protein n=1 Tax=Niastella yeongjuensis TaxID=354355 RepID=A0A1V9EYD4_9BACT|nr:DUF6438 domain-containing protein [Niastella yeongjuensis]OQP51066.1 hypothetical protein A4H97_04430 [Niastella yeongjuensis]SEN04323.1 hypothetical protein SAMN05660816_00048 [Niastella yeongjuensis]